MPRSFRLFSATLLLIAAAGCGGNKQQASQESSVDSLLASNPSEQSSGNITPQQEYQQQQQAPPTTGATASKPPSTKTRTKTVSARSASHAVHASEPGVTVPSGTAIKVAVSARVTSASAQPGDTWSGTVKDPVVVGDRVLIPAGSSVTGVVSGARPAQKGSRAFLVLAVKSIDVNGRSYAVSATADSMIAGSTRARNVGAVAGGAAAGALLGKAIGGSGKGALIGGLIGGAAATGAVAASKGYQVEVKEGAEVTFNVNDAVTMR
ncbi:MAG: hypothetical protein E6K80_09340 [Candidatus Eisenbacteria bacterium]|uniref:Glycine zipper 2TM domain-containing protein n=1 Tax=Eiseniibacteriota bacterium TaxID=2212470 RepID=A0A538U2N1_UNCEI|nr:MAG: hypothetical protein E6K80_09340 [Candidatus Eisenbacteria bacterium]